MRIIHSGDVIQVNIDDDPALIANAFRASLPFYDAEFPGAETEMWRKQAEDSIKTLDYNFNIIDDIAEGYPVEEAVEEDDPDLVDEEVPEYRPHSPVTELYVSADELDIALIAYGIFIAKSEDGFIDDADERRAVEGARERLAVAVERAELRATYRRIGRSLRSRLVMLEGGSL